MAQEVEKVVTMKTTTPSGLEIEYEPGPHTYRIRKLDVVEGDLVLGDWKDAISASTATDALNKGGLPWWGMRTGIQAVLTSWGRGKIRHTTDGRLAVFGQSAWEYASLDTVESLVKREKLDVNNVRDDAGDRGTEVHDALEAWVTKGIMPVPEHYVDQWGQPSEAQGYVRGLLKFLQALGEPKSKPSSEVMVASYEHGFAGRYDLEMVLHEVSLCTKLPTPAWTPEGPNHHSAKGPEFTVFDGRTIFDLKTPKGIYASHHLQLGLYEIARQESGYPASKQRIAIRVTPDGQYLAVPSVADPEDCIALLHVARAVKRIEKEASAK